MSSPSNPFDEQPGSIERVREAPSQEWPPPRKWSFISLGLVLFVLVWVREIIQMSPGSTIIAAVVVLFIWLVVHVSIFTPIPRELAETFAPRARSENRGQIAQQTSTFRSSSARRARGYLVVVAVVLGIWMQALVAVSPWVLTLIVVVVAILVLAGNSLPAD